MAHTTTLTPTPEPPGRATQYGTVPDGIAGWSATFATRPSRAAKNWRVVTDHAGRRIGSVNNPALLPALALYVTRRNGHTA